MISKGNCDTQIAIQFPTQGVQLDFCCAYIRTRQIVDIDNIVSIILAN